MIPIRRKNIFEVFFHNPLRSYHLREIGRLSGVSLCNVSDTLKYASAEGLFSVRPEGNRDYYSAELKNQKLIKIFEILEMEQRDLFLIKSSTRAVWENITDELIFNSSVRLQMLILLKGSLENKPLLLVVHNGDNETVSKQLRDIFANVEHLQTVNFCLAGMDGFLKGQIGKRGIMDIFTQKQAILYNEHLFWRILGAVSARTQALEKRNLEAFERSNEALIS